MRSKNYHHSDERELLTLRDARGSHRHDEVWDGVYVMAPMPNDEHQFLVARLTRILDEVVFDQQLGQVRPGVNVSDRVDDWRQNYRVPDVAVFLNEGIAKNCDSFWLGGPDLAIEIASPGEELSEKLGFYHAVNTRELLVFHRHPWSIDQFLYAQAAMVRAGSVSPVQLDASIECQSVAIDVGWVSGTAGPELRVKQRATLREWAL